MKMNSDDMQNFDVIANEFDDFGESFKTFRLGGDLQFKEIDSLEDALTVHQGFVVFGIVQELFEQTKNYFLLEKNSINRKLTGQSPSSSSTICKTAGKSNPTCC